MNLTDVSNYLYTECTFGHIKNRLIWLLTCWELQVDDNFERNQQVSYKKIYILAQSTIRNDLDLLWCLYTSC